METQYIGDFAFSNCTSIKVFYITEHVKDISAYAFNRTEATFEIDPNNSYFEVVDGQLIDICQKKVIAISSSITNEIRVPDGIIDIGVAFSDIEGLKELYLPSSVIRITSLPKEYVDGEYRYTFTLYGWDDSYVERYANENGIVFKEIN